MIKRFEHSIWILVIAIMVALSAVAIVALPDTADAQSPTEEAVPAPPAKSVGAFTEGYDYKRQLPGLVIAALIFGIAVFSAWKLPMSHEAGSSSSHTEETPEGAGVRDTPAARSIAEAPGAGRGSSRNASWGIGSAGSLDGGISKPAGAAGTGTTSSDEGGSRGEERFDALTGKLEALRRIVEEQDRRLAAMEEENFDLRRKIEAPPSLEIVPRGTTAGRR